MIVVIGGGQVGSYHARQLLKAVRSGRLSGERLLVVDRDPDCLAFRELGRDREVLTERAEWSDFLWDWLPAAGAEDHLVPTPWASHLLSEWITRELEARPAAPPRGWRLPYEVAVGDTLYLSAAAWLCPASCVEPAHCPVLHASRDWDLGDTIEEEARARGYYPVTFRLTQLAGGVASVSVRAITENSRAVRRLAHSQALIATTSRCHAAVNAIQIFTFTPRGLKS